MNRFLTTSAFLLLLHFSCLAQQFDICMEVVSASGGQGFQGNRYYAWTIGEPFVETLQSVGFVFTQGFHQPDACGQEFVGTHDLSDWGLSVYPNPTSGLITLRYSPEKQGQLVGTVFDLLGRPILDQQIMASPEGSFIDASSWQPGVYFLILRDPSSKASSILRLVRL